MIETLGMADAFRKHGMWGPGITIPGVDGGAEGYNECYHDSDEDDDDEEGGLKTRKWDQR